MTPSEAVGSVRDIVRRLDKIRAHLSDEAEKIEQQWEGLKRVGGEREDAAADLLYTLRPHLERISSFATGCASQIDMWKADPFGRNE